MLAFIESVLPTLAISVVGGGLSMYVSFKLVAHRVTDLERRMQQAEAKADRQEEVQAQIARDVAYIRGRMEGS